MKIISITPIIDEQDYYDISVEDTHNFLLADGSIVHNCGTGVGFSVERQYISNLPVVGMKVGVDTEGKVQVNFMDSLQPVEHTIKVRDSKGGWASAYRELLKYLYQGQIPSWDVSAVRPAGQ